MKKMNKITPKNWKLTDLQTGERIDAQVPGDITADLFRAQKIQDPYYGLNHNELKWVVEREFEYLTYFTADNDVVKDERVELIFEGVDLFSEIYLNGHLLGKTCNMFLRYKFDVKSYIKCGENEIRVKMLSVYTKMDKHERNGFFSDGYFACFSAPARLFLRKAQCHFGWDWAPGLPGYGLWGGVYVSSGAQRQIDNVRILTQNDGAVSFVVEVNYNVRGQVRYDGYPVPGSKAQNLDDKITVSLAKTPDKDCKDFYVETIPVQKIKNIVNIFHKKADLWWPSGYGAQPLYNYKIELFSNGELKSKTEGRLAFRTVKMVSEPKATGIVGYCMCVNGINIYSKGSNWVPLDCFTGAISDEKYVRVLTLAKNMNLNTLRVWGGGIYEKDIFYNLCDELGIMIWQDFMLSCADIPETDADWTANMLTESEYQIKRLRNRPCIVYWDGCNERPGCFGHWEVTHGGHFLDVTLRGLVHSLDGTRPYANECPTGLTDVDGDWESGDCHVSAFEEGLKDIKRFRKALTEKTPAFISECVTMGPGQKETYENIFPIDKQWPLNNEYWVDRFTHNPHGFDTSPYVQQEAKYIRSLYGEATSLGDFVVKGMQVQAEQIRAEVEYYRSIKEINSGFLNWMYSDIWPCGTCAVVDWYMEPKQVYYQMKRSFAPVLVTFVMDKDNRHNVHIVNDTDAELTGEIEYGQKALDGVILWSQKCGATVEKYGVTRKLNEKNIGHTAAYFYVRAMLNGREYKTVYSPTMWSGVSFESDYKFALKQPNDNELSITVTAHKFVKSLCFRLPDNYQYVYSDNYIDMEKGEVREITVKSDGVIDPSKLSVNDFALETSCNVPEPQVV
jgi:beta-mannosidase